MSDTAAVPPGHAKIQRAARIAVWILAGVCAVILLMIGIGLMLPPEKSVQAPVIAHAPSVTAKLSQAPPLHVVDNRRSASHAAAVAEFEAADTAFASAAGICQALAIVPTSSRNIYRLYQDLSDSKALCDRAALADSRPFGPAVPEPFRSRLNQAIHGCALAFIGKSEAYKDMMKVANGDNSPAAVLEAQTWMAVASRDVPACIKTYRQAVDDSGLDATS